MATVSGVRPPEPEPVERIHPPDAVMRVVNPVMRRLLKSPMRGVLGGQLVLLRYEGRRSGRRIELPVGRREHDGRVAVYTDSRWRHNFRGGRPAELVDGGVPRPVVGRLIEDVDTVADAYGRVIDEIGWQAAQRRLGLRVNARRTPTRDEIAAAVRRSKLSIVVFDPR